MIGYFCDDNKELDLVHIMTDHFDDSSHLICKILQLINKT